MVFTKMNMLELSKVWGDSFREATILGKLFPVGAAFIGKEQTCLRRQRANSHMKGPCCRPIDH